MVENRPLQLPEVNRITLPAKVEPGQGTSMPMRNWLRTVTVAPSGCITAMVEAWALITDRALVVGLIAVTNIISSSTLMYMLLIRPKISTSAGGMEMTVSVMAACADSLELEVEPIKGQVVKFAAVCAIWPSRLSHSIRVNWSPAAVEALKPPCRSDRRLL